MPIRISAEDKIIRDQRLTPIRIIGTLHEKFVKSGALSAKIKDALKAKKAQFAESDLVVGALRPGPSVGPSTRASFTSWSRPKR